MNEHIEDPEQDSIASALNHRLEALALLGSYRPVAGTAEAIAAAQVHATLAMVDVQIDISRLLSMSTRELNAGNKVKLAETLKEDHPLRDITHDGLPQQVSKQDPLHTDINLWLRAQELGVRLKAGDDIVVTSSSGDQHVTLLVIDTEADQWLVLRESLDGAPDNVAVDSPRIQAIFDEDISGLSVSVKKWP